MITLTIFPIAYTYIADQDRFVLFLLAENGAYEYLGAFSCLLAFIIFSASARKLAKTNGWKKSAWLVGFALGCLFIAGEEISWGYHIFKYDLPTSVIDSNFQKELNLHNSKLFQSSNNQVTYVAFWLMIFYLVITPLLAIEHPKFKNYLEKVYFPIPSVRISIIVIAIVFLHKVAINIFKKHFWVENYRGHFRISELIECMIEVSLLLLAVEIYRQVTIKNSGIR
jgi:hypothetical protein